MQLREYLLKYVPLEQLAHYPTLAGLAEAMEGVATVEELQAQGREMWTSFEAQYAAREARFKDFTLEAWAAAIRHEMHGADAKLRADTNAAVAAFGADLERQLRGFEERMRDYMRALLEPHEGVPERVTKLEEELVPRVEHLEARVFAPKRRRVSSRTRAKSRRR